MRILFLVGTALALTTSAGAGHEPRETGIPTAGPSTLARCDTSTVWAQNDRDYVVSIVTATGSTADRMRSAARLPPLRASDVVVVANDSVCTAAYNAHIRTKYQGDTTRIRAIMLIQAGRDRFIVDDAHRRAGEWSLLDIYDGAFNYLDSITR